MLRFSRIIGLSRNVAVICFLGLLCLMATMIPTGIKSGAQAVFEIDKVVEPTAEPFNHQHKNDHPDTTPKVIQRQIHRRPERIDSRDTTEILTPKRIPRLVARRKILVPTINETGLNKFLRNNSNWIEPSRKTGDKYIIYLCNDEERCYGLADRERGIATAYLLSVLTGRKFGLISTFPVPLNDYYIPNKIDWFVSEEELKGKSYVVVSLLGRKEYIGLNSVDFNKKYPQDVIYLRTNRDIAAINFKRNNHYKYTFAVWDVGTKRKLFAQIWIALMTPSNLLRRHLNNILADIALTMKQEVLIQTSLKRLPCLSTCESLQTYNNIWENVEFSLLQRNAEMCIRSLQSEIKKAPSTIVNGENQETILSLMNFKHDNEENASSDENEEEGLVDSVTVLQDVCKTKPIFSPNVSLHDIWSSQGYDYLDLNLVCAHIRLGQSPTMPFEKEARYTLKDCDVVWNFLKPYAEKGRHIFLATDAEQVRIKGKELFGSKIHVAKDPVIHIDKVKEWQDERKGMELALAEQLVLMTSCETLVVSNSGFSQRAAMIRRQLRGVKNVYMFRKKSILPWPVHF